MDKEKIIESKKDEDEFFWKQPYFAFLDILGFRELVKNNDHSTLVALYESLVGVPVDYYTKLQAEHQKQKLEIFGKNFNSSGLRLVNISDSILLWTDNCRQNSLFEISSAVKSLMNVSLNLGVPLRGAIVKGDIEVLENNGSLSIVGKGLVRAYELEGKQNWSGCIIDEQIFTYLRSIQEVVLKRTGNLQIERADWLVVETDIPMKGEIIRGHVINWANSSDLDESQIRKAFDSYNKRKNETEKIKKDIELKIQNTINFLNEFKNS